MYQFSSETGKKIVLEKNSRVTKLRVVFDFSAHMCTGVDNVK